MGNKLSSKDKTVIFCKISLAEGEEWFHGIISYVNMKKNILEIFLSAENLRNRFKEGCQVIIKSLNEDNVSLFTGTVCKKVKSIHKQAIIIKFDAAENFSNVRKHERFHVNYAATARSKSGNLHPSLLSDISMGGAMLFSKDSMEEGENVSVEIFITAKNSICFEAGIIRRSPLKDGYKYGLKLEKIDDKNKPLFNELIEYLTVQKEQIAYEWKIFKRVKHIIYTISILAVFFLVFVVLEAEGR